MLLSLFASKGETNVTNNCLSASRAALLSSQTKLITAKSFGVNGTRAEEESGSEFRCRCVVNLTVGGILLLSRREGKSFTPALTGPQRY